ncbi:MAG: asparagine synthase (glutamine-hydrolyzing) [Nanoarchaeota archaeon]|nr:asparagine synthase (glutamine-hydrolyzing) [Nanoarchaeota archaeon]
MCGIAGVYGLSDKRLVKSMCDKLIHRGPDEEGYYTDENVSLGMRRLSIIDLETGSQPIFNEDKSMVVVFNGEIYNFKELKEELEGKGHRFYTNSDTEVIVHAYEEYSIDFIKKLQGMFSIALWDSNTKRLFLIRDPMGIKPLYYCYIDKKLLFASEIKAILEYEEIKKKINPQALKKYFELRYVPAPETLFQDIYKLPPGHYMKIEGGKIEKKRYWQLHSAPIEKSEKYFKDGIIKKLKDSVQKRLIADVPLGAFLSGGIDSSVVVALMSQLKDEPIKTFSVSFEGKEYDESVYANRVADHFGTDHHEKFVDVDDVNILPTIIKHFDEPVADSAAIPTYLLSKLARKHVKVVLTGEGSDELFGGYDRYTSELKYQKYFSHLPLFTKKIAGRLSAHLPRESILRPYANFLKSRENEVTAYEGRLKGYKAFSLLKTGNDCGLRDMVEQSFQNKPDYLAKMTYFDLNYWLPDDLLMKVDKMTMANSLEARVPFLDHNFVSFAYNIPSSHKIKNNVEKYILKQSVKELLAKDIVRREKHGFSVPIKKWFEEGKGLIGQELSAENLKKVPYLDVKAVQKMLKIHKSEKINFEQKLWKVLNYVMWWEMYIE